MLHYCNSLLTGAADVHFKRLQSVQNAAARLISRARRHDHITPVLTKLHWLSVRKIVMFRAVFKGGRLQVQPPPLKFGEIFRTVKNYAMRHESTL